MLTPRLELRQSQNLVMTPQLQQAIKLLQMSNLELTSYVDQELERNPLLERSDGAAEGVTAPASSDTDGTSPTLPNATADAPQSDYRRDAPQSVDSFDTTRISGRGGNLRFDASAPDVAQTLSEGETLQQHLLKQLSLEIADPAEQLIGAHLIGAVDEAGYLTDRLDEIAAKLGAHVSIVETVLTKLQGFDPVGVLARDISECLALQLRDRDRYDPAMQRMLAHLDLVARRDITQLGKICELESSDIVDMINEIRSLDPKPGLAFEKDIVQTLVPDIFVSKDSDGSWRVALNSETLPKVLVNMRYHQKVAGATRSKDDKAYLSDCLQSANWLVKALDQRAQTILKVASELVRQQEGFFSHGVQYLRPLNLRTIAEAVDLHESTVSRVTSNKYIMSARGIHEMKYFFTSAIAAADGGIAYSAETVRQKIKNLIEAENPSQVLSDDKIVEILVSSGMDIARRTVAKYRESLRIPSSVQRRRLNCTKA